jgi:signal transduction histidine kinase
VEISASLPDRSSLDLPTFYLAALEEYLAGAGEGALRRAYEIGRIAISQGLSVLEMVAIHHQALAKVLVGRPASMEKDLRRAQEFFAESLSRYELTDRSGPLAALRHLNDTLEREIHRIAHAVHDEAGQLLAAARLSVATVARDLDPSFRERFLEVDAVLERVDKELRSISHELRPTILDDLGLVPALRFLADGISKRSRLSIHVESSLEDRPAAPIEITLYRVVQEALTNVTRHSSAREVTIQLTGHGEDLRCLVRDDGVGFDVPAVLSGKGRMGLGLIGIRERLNAIGGTLQINSEMGRGTELLIGIHLLK